MLSAAGTIHFSASDLVGHLNCRYLTSLDVAVANGALAKPKMWDPVQEILAERGARHEQGYVDHLKTSGLEVTAIDGIGVHAAVVAKTLDAMKAGAAVITQGALQAGCWSGRADVLRRVESPSTLGTWSYEIVDAKLARETKGGTVLQISLYSDLLAAAQGRAPEFAHVVVPEAGYEPQAFRLADYAAYYRRVRRSLETAVAGGGADGDLYPDPNPHCDVCRWRMHCDGKRRADDHLSLVAGIAKTHIAELKRRDVTTTAGLAAVPLPLPWKPERGAVETYTKVREQARIQLKGRDEGKVAFEPLPVVAKFGLSRLPAPSLGDIFFDLEGDPFVGEGGLEYLFGYFFCDESGQQKYAAEWALSRAEEKAAFEHFVDFAMERLKQYPDLHIYHFAPYEPAALKRLMGRYATRENEIDALLRAGVFVDLYAVVRHGIRASVESYSIKQLEPLYGFVRAVPLPEAGKMIVKIQACLELGDLAGVTQESKDAVQGYNRDDCVSTARLRDWLESVRADLIKAGTAIDRPAAKPGEPSQELSDWQKKIAELINRLTHNVPADIVARTGEQQARWLLAYILDWHRREDKAAWWEYYRLSDLSADDLTEERAGLSGLVFVETVPATGRTPVHRYSFPAQETNLRGEEDLHNVGGDKLGSVEAISIENQTIDIKKRKDTAALHPEAVFAHKVIGTKELADALVRIGEHVAEHGITGAGPYQAARDLLMLAGPRIGGQPLGAPGETILDAAIRISPHLGGGILPMQGPPGAGKTHIGARMAVTLANAGRRIGITANSHKVIRNILDEILEAADEMGASVHCIQKVQDKQASLAGLQFTTDNGQTLSAIGTSCQVGGGTAWLWARPDAYQSVDVLFVDEAAQMSLANVLAISQAAETVVLLGDPRQLEQPMQGSHPEGTDASALNHILGEHATIPVDRGLFLEETWRLHPEICSFTSELFYEGRLKSRPDLKLQSIKSTSRVNGSGLRYLPVPHEGNQNSCPEEAGKVAELVTEILDSKATWINRKGEEAPVGLEDILIIAPYNAQVFELQARIPGATIGTVDKFQGQEAPIVIYSMTTSSHADAPRGMEFLYSANRLNVATSRARCVCVIVASPQVFEAECRTPRQMQLANAFCRYLEMATVIA